LVAAPSFHTRSWSRRLFRDSFLWAHCFVHGNRSGRPRFNRAAGKTRRRCVAPQRACQSRKPAFAGGNRFRTSREREIGRAVAAPRRDSRRGERGAHACRSTEDTPNNAPYAGGHARGHENGPPLTSAVNYERFNGSNIRIHFSSWNYRGCWHQTGPRVDSHCSVCVASIANKANRFGIPCCHVSSLPRRTVGIGQVACLLPALAVVAVSQAPSPESNPRFPVTREGHGGPWHHHRKLIGQKLVRERKASGAAAAAPETPERGDGGERADAVFRALAKAAVTHTSTHCPASSIRPAAVRARRRVCSVWRATV